MIIIDPYEQRKIDTAKNYIYEAISCGDILPEECIYVINEYIKWKEATNGENFHDLLWINEFDPNTSKKIRLLEKENLYLESLNEYGG